MESGENLFPCQFPLTATRGSHSHSLIYIHLQPEIMTCSDNQSFWAKVRYQPPASRRSAATALHRWEGLNVSTAVIIYADIININTLLGGATLPALCARTALVMSDGGEAAVSARLSDQPHPNHPISQSVDLRRCRINMWQRSSRSPPPQWAFAHLRHFESITLNPEDAAAASRRAA